MTVNDIFIKAVTVEWLLGTSTKLIYVELG